MGLGFLGRESRRKQGVVGLVHVGASALGGASVGVTLGAAGGALRIERLRPWLIGLACLTALWFGLRRRPVRLGRQRQVPREWGRRMGPLHAYTLWGLLLGSGVATLMPYSSILLLFGSEISAGPATGAVAGGVFGFARGVLALGQGLRESDPQKTMNLLPRLWRGMRAVNLLVVGLSGPILLAALW